MKHTFLVSTLGKLGIVSTNDGVHWKAKHGTKVLSWFTQGKHAEGLYIQGENLPGFFPDSDSAALKWIEENLS